MAESVGRPRWADAVARTLKALWLIVRYTAVLTWETARFGARVVADIVSWLTALFYRRQQRRHPERAARYEQRLSTLQRRHAGRWQAWRALPVLRRLEISAATLALTALAVLAARAYRIQAVDTSGDGLEESGASVAVSSEREREPDAKAIAAAFDARRRAAAPGAWVISDLPVLKRGRLHEWDDFKVGSPIVIREPGGWLGRGDRYRMWYRGCRFSAGEYVCGVGHAESSDGFAWTKHDGPVFVPDDRVERERLDTIAVVRAADHYYLWYSVGLDWFNGRRHSTLHLATSRDGLKWEPKGAVLRSVESDSARVIRHAALHDGQLFHLWYLDKRTLDGPRLLMHVTAADGQGWQEVGSTAYDEWRFEPGRLSVIEQPGGQYRALFALAGGERSDNPGFFGVLQSEDGSLWRRLHEAPREGARTVPSRAEAAMPSGVIVDGGWWFWFVVRPQNGAEEIRIGYRKDNAT